MSEQQLFDPRAFHAQHRLAIIVACSENGVIGCEGGLPWHLPIDLRHFMRSTKGCAVIMGRKTFESLDAPLPNRLNIVVSRSMPQPDAQLDARLDDETVGVARDLDEAIGLARRAGLEAPIWIGGGGTIYTQAMGQVDLIVRTLVHATIDGDTNFPEIDPRAWQRSHSQRFEADDRHSTAFTIEWWVPRSSSRTSD